MGFAAVVAGILCQKGDYSGKLWKFVPEMNIGLVLIVIRLFWQLWFPEVSSTSFVFALMLVCTRLYEMDSPLLEEAQP